MTNNPYNGPKSYSSYHCFKGSGTTTSAALEQKQRLTKGAPQAQTFVTYGPQPAATHAHLQAHGRACADTRSVAQHACACHSMTPPPTHTHATTSFAANAVFCSSTC